MRKEEAELIGRLLAGPDMGHVACVVELGSSDRTHREVAQPHIAANIHHPLAARGVRVVTTDLKSGEGVEVVGDIFDPQIQARLKAVRPDVLLCCNIFEHLRDRQTFADACAALLPPGGFILVTVPNSYPYHLDPIDMMFRPTPQQIAALFPGFALIHGEVFEAGSFREDMRRHGTSVATQLVRTLVRGVWPWRGVEPLKAKFHRWFWLGRPFKMSIALLQKPTEEAA